MECAVCQVRSSVGYCIQCQKLLCETCSTPCEQCGKLCCSEHAHETRSGRVLCAGCFGERQEKRAKAKAAKEGKQGAEEDTSFGALEGAEGEDEAVDEAILVASAATPVEPWKVSVIAAGVGLAVMLLVVIVPSFRAVEVTPDFTIYTPLILIIIPLIALFWGVYGFFREEFYENRPRCLAGVGMASLTILMAVVAVYTTPMDPEQERVQTLVERRDGLPQEEMDDYRDEILGRYQ